MSRKMLKSMVVISVGIIFSTGVTPIAYAHDPSATRQPNMSHIHLKGRITTPEGAPVPDAVLERFLIGGIAIQHIPTKCVAGFEPPVGVARTQSDGRFEILLFIKSDDFDCREALDNVTIEKSALSWRKQGYDIRPR